MRHDTWVAAALRQYEKPLVRYANRILGDSDAARDVVQDCFVRLCREQPEQLNGRLQEWLFVVCRNRAIDLLRKAGRMDRLELDLPGEGADPQAELETKEQIASLRDQVERLPAREQEILHLKFAEGLAYKQIAAITGVSVGNVGFLLHRALQKLRGRMARSES
ncbi:MAG: RNA polymerase sigma factor [Planctomycetota bacterium]|jgi:RNA polymerase sigma-70 factor (ECF subfamily)